MPVSQRLKYLLGHGVLVAGLTCAFTPDADVDAQSKPLDYEVKAVYLLNFGRFATWPPGATADRSMFGVCVLGRDPFGPTLDMAVAGETIDARPVVAKRVGKFQDATGCRILFVGASESHQLKQIFENADRAAMLTVSDLPQFAELGGMIQFVSEGNKVRFAVNVLAAQRAGLTFSSELLRVATTVKTTGEGAR
jgi:hypothetical protein